MKPMFRPSDLVPIRTTPADRVLAASRDRLRSSLAVPLILSLSLMLWNALSLLLTAF